MRIVQLTFRILILFTIIFIGVCNTPEGSGKEVSAATDPTVISIIRVGNSGQNPFALAANPFTNRVYVVNRESNNISVIDSSTNSLISMVAVGRVPLGVAINPFTNFIYVTNSYSNSVSVIDGLSDIVVATVNMGIFNRPSSIAVNQSTNRIYVGMDYDYAAHFTGIMVIDGETNTVVASVSSGSCPTAVAVNPSTNRIYVANRFDHNVSVIDGVTNTVLTNVNVGEYPEGLAVNPSNNQIYVTNSSSNTVSVIDGATNTVLTTVNVSYYPMGVAVNPVTNLIYIANFIGSIVSVIEGVSNTVVAEINVGSGPTSSGSSSTNLAVNAVTNCIYVTNCTNISVIDGSRNSIMAAVGVSSHPQAVAVNPVTNRIYVANSTSNSISIIDGYSNVVMDTLGVGANSYPTGVAVNPGLNRIYVANCNSNTVSVIDGANNSIITAVNVGNYPQGVAVNPSTNRIYVTNISSDNVSVIDGVTNTIIATVEVNYGPVDVAVNPVTNRIYVADVNYNAISVIDGATNTVVTGLGWIAYPTAIAANPTTNHIYVALRFDTVSVIDGATNTFINSVNVGNELLDVAINPGINRIYVTNRNSIGNINTVSVIDGATNTVVAAVDVGSVPRGVAVNPNTNYIYVANWGNDTISVIQDFAVATLPVLTSLVPNSGNQGQTLTGVSVNGSNLTGATVLTFSGTGITASNLSVNGAGTQINANVSIAANATANARDVTITTPMGTSAALVSGFTVTAIPLVASFTYSPHPPRVGDKITFDATSSSANGGQITSYQWNFRDGFCAQGSKVNYTYAQAGQHAVTLTVTDNRGLSNSCTVNLDVQTVPAWRQGIRKGDILFSPKGIFGQTGHAGIYYGNDTVVEATKLGLLNYHVANTSMESWDKDDAVLIRVNCSVEVAINAADWAYKQIPKPYDFNYFDKSSSGNNTSWYCSELVWAAYINQGIDIQPKTKPLGGIWPFEIFFGAANNLKGLSIVGYHGEWESFIKSALGISTVDYYSFAAIGLCPVDLAVIDPDGLISSNQTNEIPDTIRGEGYFQNTDDLGSIINIAEKKTGDYIIKVTPKPGALPTDTYSLYLAFDGQSVEIAHNVQVSDIPSMGYIASSGEGGIAYSKIMPTSEGIPPYNWSATGLPAGLSMSASGVITGSPTVSGNFSIAITAIDSSSPPTHQTATMALHVFDSPTITTSMLPRSALETGINLSPIPGWLKGVAYSYSTALDATGGKGPYFWSATGLPTGMSVSTNGTISGTPTSAGTFNVTFTVADSFIPANSASKVLSLKIYQPGDAIGNGVINIAQVTKTERMILGLDPPTMGADANGDGAINMGDVTKIERFILGLDPQY